MEHNLNIQNYYDIDTLLNNCQFHLNDNDKLWMINQINDFLTNIPAILKFGNQQHNSYFKSWQVTKLRPDVVNNNIDLTVLLSNTEINKQTNYFEVKGQLNSGDVS